MSIADLPDEILVNIFKRLNSFDVLYSLVGADKKLDRVACDLSFTRTVDLTALSSNRANANAILDRYCRHILPRIRSKMECLTIEACFFQRVIHASNYPNLCRLTLVNLELDIASHIFNEKSLFIHAFKHQISHLIVMISDEIGKLSLRDRLNATFCANIFSTMTNLKYLDLDLDVTDDHYFSRSFLKGLPSTTCSSSSIVDLRIKMYNFDDCICLLDGRLSRLHTIYLNLDFIYASLLLEHIFIRNKNDSSKIIKNSTVLLKLKCFSLHVCHKTAGFDSALVPFLRRMLHLEELALSLIVGDRTTFIDGTYLEKYILSQMFYLHTFNFDIVTENFSIDTHHLPSADDIRQTFIQRGYHANCYIDYGYYYRHRCHVYSLPFNLERMCPITRSFPGDIFVNVRILRMHGLKHSFEHHFFAQISRSFPLLRRLYLWNGVGQKENTSDHETAVFSIIEYSHLVELNCTHVHIDYVEQFLCNSNTRLPSLSKLHIQYKHLMTVTNDFTRDATRSNCIKLEQIKFYDPLTMVHSKDFYLYFPSLS